MNKTLFSLTVLLLALAALSNSCTKENKVKETVAMGESVSFTSMKTSDTTSFKRSNGDVCQELVDVSATYPKYFKDEATTLKLQKIYINTVLEGNDSLAIDEAIKQYSNEILSQNSIDSNYNSDYNEEENFGNVADKFYFAVNITVAYHQNDVVTLCKEETFKKNNIASKTHKYYNIDLKNMAVIDLSMFKDDALDDVCRLLKNKLMEQNKVKTSDELNELGYFNIDNLTVTPNFCFDENGITWSFLPQELAADANLEPKITLNYGALSPFASDKSVLKRF